MITQKALTLMLGIALFASACGEAELLQGEAVRVATQSDEFCSAAYSEIWGDFDTDALNPGNAQAFAASINNVLSVLPDESPRELRRVYETFEEIAVLSIDLPIVDPQDMDAATQARYEDIFDAVVELERFDQDIVSGYVASTCPTQYASRGFLTTGSSTPAGSASGAESVAAQAAADVAVSTPQPTPEPTPIPVVSNELDVTLNIGRYDGTDVELLSVQATSATPESLLAGDPVIDPDGQSWLLVHVGLTNTRAGRVGFDSGAFRLIGADARPVTEVDRLDFRGRDRAFTTVESREFIEGFISFPTPNMVDDLAEWTFVIDQDDAVPEAIPLTRTYTNPYPEELAAGQTGQVHQAPDSDDGFGAKCFEPEGRWDAEVTEAFVSLDSQTGNAGRVPSGDRRVVVRLFVTNVSPSVGTIACDYGATLGFNMDLRLDVDGRPTAHVGDFGYGGEFSIDVGDSTTMEAVFEVDAGASTLALITGDDDEAIAEWTVDMPLILDR